MADLVSWMGTMFTVELGTIGTTDVTLGLMLALSLVAGLTLSIYKRVKGR